jgi:glycerol-3-phosphate dehydrogenase (NAD+)
MRIGLLEMKNFCNEFFKDINEKSFLEESSGVADLITTCSFPFLLLSPSSPC